MLDFTELSRDGIGLELLTRELALRIGLHPNWTGKGPDSGRDLLVVEVLKGTLSDVESRWLVDCKYSSRPTNAVSVDDVKDIRDRCERVAADGFLLVCNTCPSSELVKKLDELSSQGKVKTAIWDGVALERMLLTPNCFSLAQQFFPISLNGSKWQIFFTEKEERWLAHFRGYFFYLESRSGHEAPAFSDLERVLQEIESVTLNPGEQLRPRAIWHDTPNGAFYNVAVDYLVPSDSAPSMGPKDLSKLLDSGCVCGGQVLWFIIPRIVIVQSDYFSPDDHRYYDEFNRPLSAAFFHLEELSEDGVMNKWWNICPPLIRTFNDQVIWQKNKVNFGYQDFHGVEAVITNFGQSSD
ncbi:hypothetical protein IT893_00240 [Thalassospira sp. A40-3]|uniref:hypothetical protein n=1 Tax=Thalassospira sp. A40-3 TaxID=2785908 RepID=UPI0018CDF9EF|nr:hypothetical protein [Thalassospira sp. A40-3]QPO12004.1 hypothetical protein IT893_00240 [Thalassospira sp. A40-3]